jgi:hypothetical protein
VKRFVMFLLLTTLLTVGCGPRGTAALTQETIQELAQQKMEAVNNGDYETFTVGFSVVLQQAIPEEDFMSLRETILAASGQFETITGSRIANSRAPGYVSYVFTCQFAEETVQLTLVYAIDGDEVEGIFFNAPKLNQAMQAQ